MSEKNNQNNNQDVIKEISELKVEMRFISQTMSKMEKVLENQAVLLEKQSVANNRIGDLEKRDEKLEEKINTLEEKHDARIRKIEDWKITVIAVATLISTIFWFLLNKFL